MGEKNRLVNCSGCHQPLQFDGNGSGNFGFCTQCKVGPTLLGELLKTKLAYWPKDGPPLKEPAEPPVYKGLFEAS